MSISLPLGTELALVLYAGEILSLGKAAALAGIGRIQFGELVGERGLPRHYGWEDLQEDSSYAHEQRGIGVESERSE